MSEKGSSILIAEDDLNLGMLLLDFLESEGFQVKLCRDGESAKQAFTTRKFDLCLLDVMMPKVDGFSLAAFIREKDQHIPLIFITAKSLKADKQLGYSFGADDYITKPFDEEELLWKIRRLLRRTKTEQPAVSGIISIGNYRFDHQNQLLVFNNTSRRITEKESVILQYLCKHRNQIVKREEMLKELWGDNDYFLGRSLDVFITKIRKYLKSDPDIKIENVFGVGFILNAPPE